jgi:L,D-peptidoglycan transpeptidase YkuD (ErfK/YbiS/YcfS/YnhG family)
MHNYVSNPVIRVFAHPSDRSRGLLEAGPLRLKCALGAGGLTWMKREGDGATPVGRYALTALRIRRDRVIGPRSAVPAAPIRAADAWSEEPRSGNYNRLIRRSGGMLGDRLTRDDRLYDIVGILDWNIRPRVSYRGSAIFLHHCRPGYLPTAGCIALEPEDLKRLLAVCGRNPVFVVGPNARKRRRHPVR